MHKDDGVYTTEDAARIAARNPGLSPEALRALLRLNQLACEIRDAIARKDLAIVSQASSLLAPSLAHWHELSRDLDVTPGDAVQIALDTRRLLMECEGTLVKAMQDISLEMRRLQQGKRAIASLRARRTPVVGRFERRQ